MAADVRVARFGAVVSHNLKGVLPVLVLAVYSLAIPPEAIFGSSTLEHLKDVFALGFTLAGLTVRMIVIGAFVTDGEGVASLRRATDLRTVGVYALCRNPLYLGSLLVCFGIFLMHGSLHVVLVGTAICIALFWLMVRAEERALLERFGESYRAYCAATARWFPRLSLLPRALREMRFDLLRALRADWLLLIVAISVLWLTEYFEYLPEPAAARSQLYLQGLALLGLSAAIVAIVVQIAFRSGGDESIFADDFEEVALQKAPATLGIRVDGRVRSVDVFENLISFGQQQAILDATLEAAALRPGDRLVDVGCGSGKLAIAAAKSDVWRGAAGHILGIDATPGIIDLAVERAREANVAAAFKVGVAEALPLEDGTVDAVTSSYFFHHLPSHVKPRALREMWRVLAPGGRLVITDYSRARGLYGLVASLPMRANFYEYVRPQLGGELEDIIAAEGLGEPEIVRLFLGYITVMRLVKPA
jgi:ubiquinone/menaquinone biosynthesis C-methylase UbiE/protein-S-isoprenylcysteine O-methyltransferase Ste14